MSVNNLMTADYIWIHFSLENIVFIFLVIAGK